ncbi:hypothetical protein [Chitinophaga costaii]|uniref:hypothetical protein n=1 Tax=Chitinophaga costaii TaxID=1335309 RepID=UPI0011120A60|nr:hypothetical protein [Chitinophaga costaii]
METVLGGAAFLGAALGATGADFLTTTFLGAGLDAGVAFLATAGAAFLAAAFGATAFLAGTTFFVVLLATFFFVAMGN